VTARLLDVGLVLVVLGMAAWIIVARQTVAAVMGFVAYGLLLSLVWLRLGAPDVALTEVAIGGGLSGVLMLGAAGRLRGVWQPPSEPGFPRRAVAAALSAVVVVGLVVSLLSLPDPPPTLALAAAANADATTIGNPVTNVLMAFRAMDTMLEKVVLLLALIGAWSLAPDRFWGGRPGQCHRADPNGPLAFLARVLTPVGIVVGFYVLWVSAEYPGGAFQGGTLLAAMWLLVMMAGLTDAPPTGRRWVRLILIAGPAVFLLVGLGGMLLGDAFLAYPVAWAKPLILAIELAMIVTVAVTLGLLMAGVPERSARE